MLAVAHLCQATTSQRIVTRSVIWSTWSTQEELWKGVTSVSPAGRKRGRAKGLKRSINLHRDKIIGETGSKRLNAPGLNIKLAPIVKSLAHDRGESRRSILNLDSNDTATKTAATHIVPTKWSPRRLEPLERGWSGAKRGGTRIGPPDPINEYEFENFDSIIIEFKMVANMTGKFGRTPRFSALVVTGNGNGIAGCGHAKSPLAMAAIRKAKNRAGQALQCVELRDNTVLHHFWSKHKDTLVHVRKQDAGSGLVCHRAITAICKLIGITDLYAKTHGATGNVMSVMKAFFDGLAKQKTYQSLAETKGMYVVERRPSMGLVPIILGNPEYVRTNDEILEDEITDFNLFVQEGRQLTMKKKLPPWHYTYEFKKYLMLKRRQSGQYGAAVAREAGVW